MREPFFVMPVNTPIIIGKDGLAYIIIDGKKIPIFRMSRMVSCFWNYYQDITKPKEITDQLNQIFDDGNEAHFEKYILTAKQERRIEAEELMIIIHKSLKFGLSGHKDMWEYDFNGMYIRDYKTTDFNGFYYFYKDGWNEPNKRQLSGYSYFTYIIHGVFCTKGVITKIDRDNHRNEFSREDNLYSLITIRSFILRHPVILCYLGKITVERLQEECLQQMQDNSWMCTNCQYNTPEDCPIRTAI